jgi:hypothetical protein
MLIFLLGIAGVTSLYLAGQDGPGISAMKEDNVAQQLADGAADIVTSWFHDPSATPASIAGLLVKRQGNLRNGPSFFDEAGRSQFAGTADHPDILLDAANQSDNQTLNDFSSGFSRALGGIGRILKLKMYGPLQPGLLSTVEVTATTVDRRPVTRTVQLQLGTVTIPAVRAAVQVGQALGALQPGGESPLGRSTGSGRSHGAASRGLGPQEYYCPSHRPVVWRDVVCAGSLDGVLDRRDRLGHRSTTRSRCESSAS